MILLIDLCHRALGTVQSFAVLPKASLGAGSHGCREGAKESRRRAPPGKCLDRYSSGDHVASLAIARPAVVGEIW
jgi:hypothetical protein